MVTKLVFFFVFFRFVLYFFFSFAGVWQNILLLSAVGSVTIGALGALAQTKIKRIMAYTSISQVGFALLGMSTGSVGGIVSTVFFMFIYTLTVMAFFIVMLNTSSIFYDKPLEYISDFNGMATSRFNSVGNLIALSIVLLSMAGIPPLAGF